MKIRRILWTLIAAAALTWGQAPPEAPKLVQKLIELKNADADRVAYLVGGPGLNITRDKGMHILVVRGTREAVATVEEMIRKLDVAPPNIELAVYLITGSAQNAAEEVPRELTATTKQLHALFPYKGYRLLESFVQRTRDGHEGSTSGVLPGGASSYDFRYRSATVSDGTPRMVHLDGMSLIVRTPTKNVDKEGRVQTSNVSINTDLDIGEGQKVVVGKSSIGGSDDALILIVTAKVVE